MVIRDETPKGTSGEIQSTDAAIIVPYHAGEDNLVMIREFRVPPWGTASTGCPAGLLDPGEGLAVAVGRKLNEETGLKLVKVYRHSPAIFSSAGIIDESIAMVLAEVEGTPDTRRNEASKRHRGVPG